MADLKQKFDYVEHEGTSVIKTYQDVAPYLNRNKRLYNATPETPQGEEWREVADIPNAIAHEWMKEFEAKGIRFWSPEGMREIKKKLNDPDWKLLRTHNSRL